jgi:hypothetical protein
MLLPFVTLLDCSSRESFSQSVENRLSAGWAPLFRLRRPPISVQPQLQDFERPCTPFPKPNRQRSTGGRFHCHDQPLLQPHSTSQYIPPIKLIAPHNGTLGRSEYTISSDGTILSRMPGQSGKNPFYRGSHIVNGTVSEESRLSPTKFSTTDSFFGQREERSVTFEDGNVKEITGSKSSQTEASLADQYGRGVVDPLTAMLVPGALTDAACKGTVRVFDGRQRFDVALAFRRMGQAKAKDGYAGPALVCSGKYKPIAGKGESAFMPSFISDYLAGQEPEVILAPLSGTRLLALFRVSLNTVVGSIVVQATQFKALAR